MIDTESLRTWLQEFELATAARAGAVLVEPVAEAFGDLELCRHLQSNRFGAGFAGADQPAPETGVGGHVPWLALADGWQGWGYPFQLDGGIRGAVGTAASSAQAATLPVQGRLLVSGVTALLRAAVLTERERQHLGWLHDLAENEEHGAAAPVHESFSVYSSFLSAALRAGGAYSGSLMLVNPVSNLPVLVSSAGLKHDAWQDVGDPLIASAVIRDGRPTLLGGINQDARFYRRVRRSDVDSALSIPLTYGGRVCALLNLNRSGVPGFTAAELEQLATWAQAQGAVVGVAARLYELRQKEVELTLVKTLGHMGTGSRSRPPDGLQAILDDILAAVHGRAAFLRLVRPEATIVLASPRTPVDGDHAALLDAISGCLEAGSPLVEPNLAGTRSRLPVESVLPAGWRSCLAVSMPTAESQVLLAVFGGQPRLFASGETQFLQMAAGYIAAASEMTRLRRHVDDQQVAILDLTGQVVQAQEEERRRVALELHDEISQALSSLYFQIQTIERMLPTDLQSAQAQIQEISASTRHVLDSVISLIYRLRPTVLDRYGLFVGLRQLVRHFMRQAPVRVNLEISGHERRLHPDVEVAVYRIVQESLHNVRKHSGADQAFIALAVDNDRIEGRVEDNGSGFDFVTVARSEDPWRHVGLMGMRERAQNLGGTFAVGTGTNARGTAIHFRIPIQPSRSQSENRR